MNSIILNRKLLISSVYRLNFSISFSYVRNTNENCWFWARLRFLLMKRIFWRFRRFEPQNTDVWHWIHLIMIPDLMKTRDDLERNIYYHCKVQSCQYLLQMKVKFLIASSTMIARLRRLLCRLYNWLAAIDRYVNIDFQARKRKGRNDW